MCACVFICACMMKCLEVPEYISRCVQSAAALQLLYPPPPLAHLKWQFVKHGPPLALFLSSKPFPARLLPSLICPSALPFASLVLLPFLPFPSFSLSLLSFPSFSYLLCTLHLLLSPPLCLFISPSLSSPSLFFSHLVSLVHVRFLLHYIFFSPSVLPLLSAISPSCT